MGRGFLCRTLAPEIRRAFLCTQQAGFLTHASSSSPPSRYSLPVAFLAGLRNYSSGPVREFHPASLFCPLPKERAHLCACYFTFDILIVFSISFIVNC